jgi:hypothetical protein
MEYQQEFLYQNDMESKILFKFSFVLSVSYDHDFQDLNDIFTDYEIIKHKKGELRKNQVIRDASIWSLNSDAFVCFTLEEALNVFFLKSGINELIALDTYLKEQKMLHCKIQIVQGNVMPGISLSTNAIQFFYEKKCQLSIDLYDLRG